MRITQARTTAKKVLTLNEIKGVDLSSAPLSVKPFRASYMKNMICKGGTNHKRNGFVQAAQFLDTEGNDAKINGIYPLSKGEYFAVHAGSDLIECNSDFSYNGSTLGNDVKLANEKSQGFYSENGLCLLSSGKLYHYDTKKDGKLLPLFDSEKAYVPTTSIGITDTEHGSLIEPYEEVNLFSTKRMNKLTGQKNGVPVSEDKAESFVSKSSATFYLDGKIDLTKSVKVTVDVYIANQYGENYGEKWAMPLNAFWGGNLTHVVSNLAVNTVFDEFNEEGIAQGKSTFVTEGYSHEVDEFIEDSSSNTNIGKFKCTIGNIGERGVITFTPALPSPVLGEDNITVEYSVAKEEPKIKCACEVSLTAKGKQLAIVTEDDVVYYSSPAHGWGYFPDKSYIKAINNVAAVFDGDGALVVTSRHESAVISFNIRESDGLVVVPRVNAIYSDIGSISPYASVNLEGDTLVLTRKGVFGIGPRGVYIRSSAINKELLKFSEEDFNQAVACEHDARYYLFIGGIVYIADARYKVKFHEGERLASSFEYEWWRWELGAPSSVLCHNDKMYIGRDDGRMLCLSDGYVDREELELKDGEEYNLLGDGVGIGYAFAFDEDIDLTGAEIEICNAFKDNGIPSGYIESVNIDTTNSVVTANIIYDPDATLSILEKICEQKEISIMTSNGAEFESIVKSINFGEDESAIVTVTVPVDSPKFETHTVANIFVKVTCERFLLKEGQAGNEKKYFLVEKNDSQKEFDEDAVLYNYDNMTAKLIWEKPVECELHSAVLNLGSDIKEKVLHELCFVPSVDTTGEVLLGFETNKNGDLSSVGDFGGAGIISGLTSSTSLDIGGIDFNSFTFDASFVHTFKKRLHERGVEFVKFKIASKTADDFGVERLNCIYSYYTR